MNDNNAGLNDDNHRNYTVNVYMGLQVFLATSIENGCKNLREILCNRGDTILRHGGLHTDINQCNQGS